MCRYREIFERFLSHPVVFEIVSVPPVKESNTVLACDSWNASSKHGPAASRFNAVNSTQTAPLLRAIRQGGQLTNLLSSPSVKSELSAWNAPAHCYVSSLSLPDNILACLEQPRFQTILSCFTIERY